MSEKGEKFLARWSRLKREEAAAPPAALSQPVAPAADPDSTPPELPPLDKLTIESDYTGFFHPKVDAKLRQAAIRKLFADPNFNVMDGLYVYIEDYSKPDPLSPEMLAGLKQAQRILAWAREDTEKSAREAAAAAQESPPRSLEQARAPAAAVPDPMPGPPSQGQTVQADPKTGDAS